LHYSRAPLNAELRSGRSGTLAARSRSWRNKALNSLLLSLHHMAARIVSWGCNEKTVSPGLSKTPSMVSLDSLLSDNPETPPATEVAPHATESQAKNTSFQVIEPNASGSRACSSVSVYPGADAAAEGSFIRHHKYFFKDGNVTFLVRDIQS